jgi:hypothetical protein
VCATLLLQNTNKYSSSSCCTFTATGLQWLADEQVKESTNQPAATAQCEMQQLQQTNEQKKVTAIKKTKIPMSQYGLQNKVTKKVVSSFYLFGKKKYLK